MTITNGKVFTSDKCPRLLLEGHCPHKRAEKMHACPYYSKMHNDESFLCRCCPSCTEECAAEVSK